MPPSPETPPWLAPRPSGLRVWALEPYYGGSHRQFLEELRRCSRHHIVEHSLPGRAWKWRMHGAALTFARRSFEELATHDREVSGRETSSLGGRPQVLFVSDMLDLATYKALAHPAAAAAPALLYMHENQLTYPLPEGVERDLGYGVKNVTSALAAELVVFNSVYHRDEFLGALGRLLDEVPDAAPRWVLDEVGRRSRVLPVGCDLRRLDAQRPPGRSGGGAGSDGAAESSRWGVSSRGPLILWNQRWEYDKAPGDLFRALYALKERGVGFRLALAGANHGLPTAEFVEARERLAEEVVQWGRVESAEDYASLLWAADIVVSTALHEFFGVAVVEALYCGCRPVLPHRLSYPEIVPRAAHEWALYQEGGLVSALERAVREVDDSHHESAGRTEWQRTWVGKYDWSAMGSRYDAVIEECWEAGRRSSTAS
ncbi:MAG: tRNA-queuosine alpha-mannosyltransferase domain-containing protein [Thermoleophilia bacterium]